MFSFCGDWIRKIVNAAEEYFEIVLSVFFFLVISLYPQPERKAHIRGERTRSWWEESSSQLWVFKESLQSQSFKPWEQGSWLENIFCCYYLLFLILKVWIWRQRTAILEGRVDTINIKQEEFFAKHRAFSCHAERRQKQLWDGWEAWQSGRRDILLEFW